MTFAGVRPVVHLPLDDRGAIAFDEVTALVDRMIAFGASGIVVLGLATESWGLRADESDALCEAVVASAAGRVAVTAGVDGDTAEAVSSGARALAAGVTSVMLRPPNGSRPRNLVAHFGIVADELGVPMLVQDAPQSTGVEITAEDLCAITDHQLLRSVKIEAPNPGAKISTLVAAGVEVIAGWGGMHYLESVRRGAAGCMPGSDLGPAFVEIDRLVRAGEEAKADDIYRAILPLLSYEAQSLELLIVGAKLALQRAGVFTSARLRSDDFRLDAEQQRTFQLLFDRLEDDDVPGW